ncbi:MAG: hypothetical protein EZS28_025704 [Streblomastix strix]|uniref:Uncharacterized protein n=1 Tax=Streblomastix strix TaxID=222440 RepID=A0A5J4V8E3_9EUKA|nr:MAG: hypothetical protein EZS28_025704 [Streblomastix strix]
MFAKEYKLDEKITQMIHVNCSEELNCPKRIVSRQSSVVNEFQITILSVFGELSDISIDVDDYLPKGFGIIAHLEPIIISPFLTLSNEIQSPEDALISSH